MAPVEQMEQEDLTYLESLESILEALKKLELVCQLS